MAIALNPSLSILLGMVAVLLFLSVRNIREDNRRLSMEVEVSGTVLLQSEERVAICKADLSSQVQVKQEMGVAKEKRIGEQNNVEDKVKMCTLELEEMKIKYKE